MAHQLKMATVQQILSLHAEGWSQRRIARELGISRDAVARYVHLAQTAPAAVQESSAADCAEPVGAIPQPLADSKPATAPPGSPAENLLPAALLIPWHDGGARPMPSMPYRSGSSDALVRRQRLSQKAHSAARTPIRSLNTAFIRRNNSASRSRPHHRSR